jgi:hypothetical protein
VTRRLCERNGPKHLAQSILCDIECGTFWPKI